MGQSFRFRSGLARLPAASRRGRDGYARLLSRALFMACGVLFWSRAAAAGQDLPRVRIDTPAGRVVVEVDVDRAPVTSCNFLRYVARGHYDGGLFFRTVHSDRDTDVDRRISVVQGASRRPDTEDSVRLERTNATGLSHIRGTVSMARTAPDTAKSSFFVVITDSPALDFGGHRNPDGQGFAAFGRVTDGLDILDQIWARQTRDEMLIEPVSMKRVEILSMSTAARAVCSSLFPARKQDAGPGLQGAQRALAPAAPPTNDLELKGSIHYVKNIY